MPGYCHARLPDFIAVAARAYPDKTALQFGRDVWTFAELDRRVDAASTILARKLESRPFAGRIGLLAANRPGVVFAIFAAMRLGVTFVPHNVRQAEEELSWQVADAEISLLVADQERWRAASGIAGRGATSLIAVEALESLHEAAENPRRERRIDLSRDAAILYTSGTTGRPKGARLTWGNLWWSAVASALHLGHNPDDIWLCVLPLFHVGGLSIVIRGVIGAAPVVLHERFDPERVNAAIDAGTTLVSLVPMMLSRLIAQRGESPWPDTLRCVLLGGSATPAPLLAEAIRLGIPVAPTYGLTESASQVTTLLPGDVARKPGSAGLPLPVSEIRIANGGDADPGAAGQIEIRGPTIFPGYLGDRDDAPARNDGWFATGDDGYLDGDGYLYVVDRRGDLIVSGGENIYPAEIERVLLEHPDVLDAGVIGIASADWGERPVAAIVWRGDPALAEPAVLAHCAERLGRFKLPQRVVLVNALPRSPSGKLLRRELRTRIAGR